MNDIIKTIEKERLVRNIDISDLCKQCGISRTTYWRIVSGKCDVKISIVERLIRCVGFDIMVYKKV